MPAAAAWLVGLLCFVRISACASNVQFTAAGTQADKNDLMEQFVAHGFAAIEAPPLLIKEAEELLEASAALFTEPIHVKYATASEMHRQIEAMMSVHQRAGSENQKSLL